MPRIIVAALTATAIATPLSAPSGAPSKLTVLHSFCETEYCTDGGPSYERPLVTRSGDIYGTNFWFGPYGGVTGSVFQLKRSGPNRGYSIIYGFCPTGCSDGALPTRLIMDVKGNVYGIATNGGDNGSNSGTIFELSPNGTSWTFKKLYDFGDGYSVCGCYSPTDITYSGEASGALYDGVSPLFGTTSAGGGLQHGVSDPGTVFQLTPQKDGSWSAKTIYTFCSVGECTDGMTPATIVATTPARLFGTTALGGTCSIGFPGCGVVFQLSYASGGWRQRVLYASCGGTNCPIPGVGGRLLVHNGALFGTSPWGGAQNEGAVFKIVPTQTGSTQQILYSFCSLPNCSDGEHADGGLTLDSTGALVGTTENGGAHRWGTVFQLKGTRLNVLYSFCPKWPACDGREPSTGVALGPSGALFGVTAAGGDTDNGGVYRLVP